MPEIASYLITAVVVVDRYIINSLRLVTVAIIYDKGNPHMAPQIHIILVTEPDQYQSIHIPHGSKFDDLFRIGGFLYHHELAIFFKLCRKTVERRGNKHIL